MKTITALHIFFTVSLQLVHVSVKHRHSPVLEKMIPLRSASQRKGRSSDISVLSSQIIVSNEGFPKHGVIKN